MILFILHAVVSVIGAAGFFGWLMFRKTDKRRAWFGVFVFIFASGYLLSEKGGALSNWQSIFSSGMATLAVVLYFAGLFRPQWRRPILQSFLVIFKIIWIGLGLLVLSELEILLAGGINAVRDLYISAPFIFSQMLIALIMLNGVYIGKRIGFGLVMLLKQEPVPVPPAALAKRIAASGSLSIVSWYFLLAAQKGLLDAYGLGQILAGYAGVLTVAILAARIYSETTL